MADDAAGASPTPGELTLRVPAEAAMLRQLRAALRAWLRRLRWPDDESTAILHAVDEACTNVIQHAYAFEDAGEIELAGREDRGGLRRHVVIDVLDRGRWQDTGTRHVGANGLAIMRGLMHRVNVQVRPEGTRVSLISCAVPQPTTSSRARSNGVRAIGRDRVEFALDEAAAHCRRARELVGSARALVQAGRRRRQAQAATSS